MSGTADAFASMGTPGHSRIDHARYIDEVLHRVEARDVAVTLVSIDSSGGRREARLTLQPNQAAFAETVPEEASLAWDEENGWWLAISAGPGASFVPAPVFKGLSVLPDPEDVAAWVAVLLTHPELTPSREDHPFRDHATPDPAFEDELAQYAPRP